jgi:hypothetical protein
MSDRRMLIEASVRYGADLSDVLPEGMFHQGVEVAETPDGVSVRYEGAIEYRGADIAPVLQFVVDAGSAATGTLIGAWIVSRFKGKVQKITINRREIDLDDQGQVRRIVEEEFKIGKPK